MKISAYVYINRGEDYDFPYREAISSVLWCDQVVIGTDSRFNDGTLPVLTDIAARHDQVTLIVEEFDYDVPNPHGAIKQRLRDACDGDWLIELDADEYLRQNQTQAIREFCLHCPLKVLVVAVPVLNFFNGDFTHQGMPAVRPLLSRNVRQVRHDSGTPNLHGRMGAAYLTDRGNKLSPGVYYPELALLHYGWYSLPRKWELTHQTLHYYEGRLDGTYDNVASYQKNLDDEDVDFWDVPWRLPIEHYAGAIHSEMRAAPLKRFRGKHPAAMTEWRARQRVLAWRQPWRQKILSLFSFAEFKSFEPRW